jgi:hypothetical protein
MRYEFSLVWQASLEGRILLLFQQALQYVQSCRVVIPVVLVCSCIDVAADLRDPIIQGLDHVVDIVICLGSKRIKTSIGQQSLQVSKNNF